MPPLRITIVTPSFNQAGFLEETIRSVTEQNYPNLEYMVIDGGSTDGSVEIIRKHADRLAYWTSEPDGGQTDAINKGFRRATGDIVAYLNSDDIYLPGCLEAVTDAFTRRPKTDLVYGNTDLIDRDSRILRDMSNVPFWWPAQVVCGTIIPQPASFWRRSLFDRFGYLDASCRFCMDYEFFCRVGHSISVRHLRRRLAGFRLHRDQKTETIQTIGAEERAAIRSRYMNEACRIWPPWFVRLAYASFGIGWRLAHGEFRYLARGLARRGAIAVGRSPSLLNAEGS